MIPLPNPKPVPIEPEFYELVHAFENRGIQLPPLTVLRAFAELGRIDERKELHREIAGLRHEIARLRRNAENKKAALKRSRDAAYVKPSRISMAIRLAERNQVLKHLASGMNPKEISHRMNMSLPTVYRRIGVMAK